MELACVVCTTPCGCCNTRLHHSPSSPCRATVLLVAACALHRAAVTPTSLLAVASRDVGTSPKLHGASTPCPRAVDPFLASWSCYSRLAAYAIVVVRRSAPAPARPVPGSPQRVSIWRGCCLLHSLIVGDSSPWRPAVCEFPSPEHYSRSHDVVAVHHRCARTRPTTPQSPVPAPSPLCSLPVGR
jgi:hypothetical protein